MKSAWKHSWSKSPPVLFVEPNHRLGTETKTFMFITEDSTWRIQVSEKTTRLDDKDSRPGCSNQDVRYMLSQRACIHARSGRQTLLLMWTTQHSQTLKQQVLRDCYRTHLKRGQVSMNPGPAKMCISFRASFCNHGFHGLKIMYS